MRKLIFILILIAALFSIAALAPGEEESSILEGLIVESVPAAPTDITFVSVTKSQITLSWRDNSSTETRYEIWRAVFSSDLHYWVTLPPDTTSYTDTAIESGTTYSYMVRVVNNDGHSDSDTVSATTPVDDDDDTDIWISCFIATAVYQDPYHPDVQALREFRDEYLLTNPAGRAFVSAYYRYSPPVADFIAGHEALRLPLRALFIPVAASARHPAGALFIFTGVLVLTVGRAGWKRFRRSR